MGTAVLQRLLCDPIFVQCQGIGLAGGEPTIAPLSWQLLDMLPPDKLVTITTNALTSERLVDYLRSATNRNRFTVQLSLDGIGPVNDTVRGVAGAYNKTLDLLLKLEALEVRRLISFTINQLNTDQLLACYELAETHGALFSMRLAYSGGAYSNQDNYDIHQLDKNSLTTIDRQVQTILDREIVKPYHFPAQLVFWRRMTDYARGEQKNLPCKALHSGVVIDPYGNVFPNCPVMMQPIGNLHDFDLTEIWHSAAAEKARDSISRLTCGGCWNDCQVVNNIATAEAFLEHEYTLLQLNAILKEGGCRPRKIDFNFADSAPILSGWFGLDGPNDFRFRWTGPRFSLLAPDTTSTVLFWAMFPELPSSEEPQTVGVLVGKASNDIKISGAGQWREYRFTLPQPAMAGDIVHFTLSSSFCPAAGGRSKDFRQLGMAIHMIEFA